MVVFLNDAVQVSKPDIFTAPFFPQTNFLMLNIINSHIKDEIILYIYSMKTAGTASLCLCVTLIVTNDLSKHSCLITCRSNVKGESGMRICDVSKHSGHILSKHNPVCLQIKKQCEPDFAWAIRTSLCFLAKGSGEARCTPDIRLTDKTK